MSDPSPPGLGPLLTVDGMTGMVVAIISSFVAGMQAGFKGIAILTTSIAAAVLSAVVVPPAIKNGYGWGDWLGLIVVMCGALAGVAFMLIATLGRRLLARGDTIADVAIDRVLGPEKKP